MPGGCNTALLACACFHDDQRRLILLAGREPARELVGSDTVAEATKLRRTPLALGALVLCVGQCLSE